MSTPRVGPMRTKIDLQRAAAGEVGDQFRHAMRRVASTVCVVTASDGARRHGMTVTAVTSVSMGPPTLLICINRTCTLHELLLSAKQFCVNVLGSGQKEIAAAFSGGMPPAERFADGNWIWREDGVGQLRQAQAVIVCRKEAMLPYVSHTVFLGTVEEVHLAETADPLIYCAGSYNSLATIDGPQT